MQKTKKKNFTKKEISRRVNSEMGLTKNYTEKLIDDLIKILQIQLKKENLNINNFGLFKLIKKNERVGRNPKTNEVHTIIARKSISFVASKNLNLFINNS